MSLSVDVLDKREWLELWSGFHKDGFGEESLEDGKFCSFPLVVKNGYDRVAYATVKENDAETATINFGCVFSNYRASGLGNEVFKTITDFLIGKYLRVGFRCSAKNKAMIILATKQNYEIIGALVDDGCLAIEFLLERTH